MKVLVINAGSSSMKFTLFSMADKKVLAKGQFERLGTDKPNMIYKRLSDGLKFEGIVPVKNLEEALKRVCAKLVDPADGVMKELPGFPIVLHGSSSVPQEEVDTINKYGGKLKAAIGIPEDELRKAASMAVCKINIDSDSRLAMTAAVRKVLAEHPEEFDPRKYLGPARENMRKLYIHKIVNVLGSDRKAE